MSEAKATQLHHNCETCPHCSANLIASEIPKEHRPHYLGYHKDPKTGKYVENEDHGRPMYYYRMIGLSSWKYDRTLAYQCPDCKAIDVIPGCERMYEDDLKDAEPTIH